MSAAVTLAIDEQNPWPGLSAFDESAQRFFNGRREESAALRRLVMQAPLTVLFGASGLGKTSLLQAGLFPLLRQEHVLPVYIRLDLHDRSAPLIDQVRLAFEAELRSQGADAPSSAVGESLWEYLHRDGLELWSRDNHLLTPLFVFDQFEELFTLGASNGAAVARLRIDLADLIENRMPDSLVARAREQDGPAASLSLDGQRYKVLLSFREDFLAAVEGLKREIPSIMRSRLRLLPMSGEQAFDAVHTTAPHLADAPIAHRIVSFVAAAGDDGADAESGLTVEPALLSLVCRGLNEKRKEQKKAAFDAELLQGTGQEIVADFYRETIADMPPQVRRFIERELITERGFRKPCDVDDARQVHGVADRDLRTLVDRRLLRIEPSRGSERVELTHDLLTPVVREHRERQREEERRAKERQGRRRLTAIGSALGAIALVMVGLTYTANAQRLRAERQGRVALGHLLSGAAINAGGEGDAAAARLFALNAVAVTRDVDRTVLPDAEDALRRLQAATAVSLPRPGHSSDITRIDVSPDGRRVATYDGDSLHIWNVAQAEEVISMRPGPCGSMEFTRDWTKMACRNPGPGESQVWDLEKGQATRSVSSVPLTGGSHAAPITQFRISQDGTLLLAGTDAGVTVSDDGSYKRDFAGRLATFSPDGKLLATVVKGDGADEIQIWDVASGRSLKKLEPQQSREDRDGMVRQIVFSRDSSRLAAAGVVIGPSAPVRVDPRLSDSGPSVRLVGTLWDIASGERIVDHSASCVAFSEDGSSLAMVDVRMIYIVDASTKRISRVLEKSFVDQIDACRFDASGNLILESHRGDVRISEAWARGSPSTTPTRTLEGPVVALDGSGTRGATANGSSATVEDFATNTKIILPAQDERLLAATLSSDLTRVVTAGGDGRARVWDVASGKRLVTLIGHTLPITAMAYSPDGHLIATAGVDRVANVWDAQSGRLLRGLTGHMERILGIAFSPDSRRIATAGYDRTVRIWDAESGKELTASTPIRSGSPMFRVAFSSDGKRLAFAGTEGGIVDVASPGQITKLDPLSLASALAFSPDGQTLAAVDSQGVKVWRPGSQWQPLPDSAGGPAVESMGLVFSRDGLRLVGPGTDFIVRIWDTASLKEAFPLYHADVATPRAVAFSADETSVFIVGDNWALYRLPIRLDDVIALARKRLVDDKGSLSDQDCAKYLREPSCPAQIRRTP